MLAKQKLALCKKLYFPIFNKVGDACDCLDPTLPIPPPEIYKD